MILLENLKDLAMFDSQIVNVIKRDLRNGFGGKGITNNSKIEIIDITSNKEIKDWVEKLFTDDDMYLLVFRLKNTQCLYIQKDKSFDSSNDDRWHKNNHKFFGRVLERFKYDLNMGWEYQKESASSATMTTFVKKMIKKISEHYDVPVSTLDVMVMYFDDERRNITQQRTANQKNIVPLPRDEQDYKNYIYLLKNGFEQRLINFKENKIKNITTQDELLKVLQNDIFKKFKFKGHVYSLDRVDSNNKNAPDTLDYRTRESYTTVEYKFSSTTTDDTISISVHIQGLNFKLGKLEFNKE